MIEIQEDPPDTSPIQDTIPGVPMAPPSLISLGIRETGLNSIRDRGPGHVATMVILTTTSTTEALKSTIDTVILQEADMVRIEDLLTTEMTLGVIPGTPR